MALIDELLRRGAAVCAYDPAASTNAARVIGSHSQLSFAGSAMEAAEGADGLAIVTEWKEFRSSDLQRLRATMRQAIIFDGRNILDPQRARAAGFEYSGIGRS